MQSLTDVEEKNCFIGQSDRIFQPLKSPSSIHQTILRPIQKYINEYKRCKMKRRIVSVKRNEQPFMFHWNELKRIPFISITDLCNDTRLIITGLRKQVIEGKILIGTHAGKTAFIPRISFHPAASSDLSFTLHRRQFPVRLAFVMTINKAQG